MCIRDSAGAVSEDELVLVSVFSHLYSSSSCEPESPAYFFRIFLMPVGLSLPWVSSPTTMMGASAQAPRHITDSRVNLLSGVVSPSLMPSWLMTSSLIWVCLLSASDAAAALL